MNAPHPERPINTSGDAVSPAEQTLRMLAKLPAPDGLSARVQANLRIAPRNSSVFNIGGVLGISGWMHSGALRIAAAVGIVVMVAGGGWQIYSRVQTSPGLQGTAVPMRVNPAPGPAGGFSTSGAIARPDPLKGPVITHRAVTNNAEAAKKSGKKRPASKPPQPPARKP